MRKSASNNAAVQVRGLVRIALTRAFSDGTVAVELDPLSLLCRLATSVPPPRFHQVKYAGVVGSASPWRARIAPKPAEPPPAPKKDDEPPPRRWNGYRPWAELLARTFGLDVLTCPKCGGRMQLVAMVTESQSVRRFLAKVGEPTDVPAVAEPGAAVLEEHRPALQGRRGGRGVKEKRGTAARGAVGAVCARSGRAARSAPRARRESGGRGGDGGRRGASSGWLREQLAAERSLFSLRAAARARSSAPRSNGSVFAALTDFE